MPLFETSAKDDSVADHVDGIFLTLAHKLREGRSMIEPVPDPSNPENRPVSFISMDFQFKVPFLRFECCTQAAWQLRHQKKEEMGAVFEACRSEMHTFFVQRILYRPLLTQAMIVFLSIAVRQKNYNTCVVKR